MSTEESGAAPFTWREWPGGGCVEHPALRQPVSLIVDDPNPGYNPAYFHLGFRHGPRDVPRGLIDEFANLVETAGIKGKFSVIPNPFGLGRVDHGVQGISQEDLRYFLDAVRERIAPVMDITPEVLTHWNAIDLATGCLLPYWEHVWSREQDRRTLQPYLALALQILNNVDLPCSGMTSPWDFGDGVEDEYAAALLAAQQEVNGLRFTWYFLQMDNTSAHVPPRIQILNPERREAVVGIVCCDARDFGRGVWMGGEPNPDELISADGQQGRLAQVLRNGGPGTFHTHWQTLFSGGRPIGLQSLAEVARRIHEHFGSQIVWMRCADLARYTAAAAATQLLTNGHGYTTAAPFDCDTFTVSLETPRPVRSVQIDGQELRRVETAGAMGDNCYLVAHDRVTICWPLRDGQRLDITAAEGT
jgi:hypothetical protein